MRPLTLALIGAGHAGRGLASEAIRAGHRVVLEDVLPSRLREARAEINVDGTTGSLETVTTVEDAVRNADLAIDFVPDELESKLEIACMVDRMAPPATVLCLATFALGVSDLASCTYRADRCVGVQIAGAAVTVVSGAQSSRESVELVSAFFRSLGKQVTVHEELIRPA